MTAKLPCEREAREVPRRHTPERVIRKLCEAERLRSEAGSTAEAEKQPRVSELTVPRWRTRTAA